MSFNEIMILEDGSLTAQETEIFWLAKGWASHGSAAGHQAYFSGLRHIGPSQSAGCLFTRLLSPATISTSCEGELSDGARAQLKAASAPQPAATKHHSPIKSLHAYCPNQAPIKDTPRSTLLLWHLFCPTSIMNLWIKSARCAVLIKPKNKIKFFVLLYSIVQIWFLKETVSSNKHAWLYKDYWEISAWWFLSSYIRQQSMEINFYRKCIKTPVSPTSIWTSKESQWKDT